MRLYQSGAEMQTINEFNDVSGEGVLTVSTAQHTGTGSAASYLYSMNDNSWIQDWGYFPVLNTPSTMYQKQDVYFSALTATTNLSTAFTFGYPIRLYGSNYLASVGIYNSAGTLHLFVQYGTSSTMTHDITLTGIGLNTWFRLEAGFDSSPADGSETFEVKVNGVSLFADTNLTYASKTIAYSWIYAKNDGGGGTHAISMYVDNISVNDNTGSSNNTWIGQETIAPLVPISFGDNTPDSGSAAAMGEIPATTTTSSSSNYSQLNFSSSAMFFNITNPTTYMNSYDIVNAVSVPTYVREATSGTTSYQTGIKSAAGATPTLTTASDAGNTTVRVSPNGLTSHGRLLISETDPTTGARWKVTGTNSLSNAQIGAKNLTGAGTWYPWQGAMVAYTTGSPVTTHGMLLLFW